MSISKLLMTAAVCTLSMATFSTSYGAEGPFLGDDDAAAASPRELRGIGFATPGDDDDDDRQSVATLRSTRSSSRQDYEFPDIRQLGTAKDLVQHLADALSEIRRLQQSENRRAMRVNAYLDERIREIIAVPGINPGREQRAKLLIKVLGQLITKYQIQARTLADVESRLAGAETALNAEKARLSEIEAALKAEKAADVEARLVMAQAHAVKAAASSTRWKNTTILTSASLTVVAGVLVHIIHKHGWEIMWGK